MANQCFRRFLEIASFFVLPDHKYTNKQNTRI